MRPSLVLALAALLATGSTAAAQARALQPFRSETELRAFVAGIGRDYRPKIPASVQRPTPQPPQPPPASTWVTEPAECAAARAAARAVAGLPASARGTISGRVVSAETGSPSGHVLVRTACNAAEALTDAEGRYRLPVAPGTHVLTVSAIGSRAEAEHVTVGAGEAVTIDFVVEPASMHEPQTLPRVPPGAGPSTYGGRGGFDEGGIVKAHGDHLVILRRGRLFTVRIGGGRLRPVSSVNVHYSEDDADEPWWNATMLLSEDHVVVTAHTFEGTLLRIFGIDAAGRLRDRATYGLVASEGSSLESSAHLLGGKLVLYASSALPLEGGDPAEWLPALWRPRPGGDEEEPIRVTGSPRVFHPARPLHERDQPGVHVVMTCSLQASPISCESSAVIAPRADELHLSPRALYVWTHSWHGTGTRPESVLYRMPLDGTRPTALAADGWPAGQFSFLESEDRHLNVVVSLAGDSAGLALMRVPLAAFGDGRRAATAEHYRVLPGARAGQWLHTRFVGPYLLYGEHASAAPAIHVVWWARGDTPVLRLPLAHPVHAIVPMGSDALVAGGQGGALHFSSVRLAATPELGARYTRRGGRRDAPGHGSSYRADGPGEGVLGLLVRGSGRVGSPHWRKGTASMVFLSHRGAEIHEIGELAAQPELAADGGCRVQPACAVWYDDARPLFVEGRIFALLGYELVEGRLDRGRIREVRRIDFTPR